MGHCKLCLIFNFLNKLCPWYILYICKLWTKHFVLVLKLRLGIFLQNQYFLSYFSDLALESIYTNNGMIKNIVLLFFVYD